MNTDSRPLSKRTTPPMNDSLQGHSMKMKQVMMILWMASIEIMDSMRMMAATVKGARWIGVMLGRMLE